MEPFGYNLDGRKLGFLNECIYGLNLLPEATMMQFHPLGEGAMLYTEGPVTMEKRGERLWTLRTLGTTQPMKAALNRGKGAAWRATTKDGRLLPSSTASGCEWFEIISGNACLIDQRP
jgi:hypothetical protein